MKITNKYNLPQALVNAVQKEQHNTKENYFSVTTIMKANKQILLSRRHYNEMEQDVSDSIWALFGTAVHSLLEHEGATEFAEEFLKFDFGSKVLTGKIDNYDMEKKIITDYKTCSVWKILFGDFEDWKQQLMLYAMLCRLNGLECEEVRIIAFMKDWSSSKAKYDSSYPQSQVFEISWKVTESEMTSLYEWTRQRFAEIEKDLDKEDDIIECCSEKERWQDKTKYAVKKDGRKTAIKVFDDLEEAESFAIEKGKDHFVEIRPSEPRKCMEYCTCNKWCNFYKNYMEEQ